MWLWIFASAAEVPLVHLLVPWEGVRFVLLLASVWGLVWMVGLLASLYVYPHLLGPATLRVRYGASHSIALPWDAVASLTHRRQDLDSSVWTLQPRETEDGVDLQVGVSGQVNVHARLRRPTVVTTAKGPMEVVELSFFADDPQALVAHARRIIAPQDRRGPLTVPPSRRRIPPARTYRTMNASLPTRFPVLLGLRVPDDGHRSDVPALRPGR